MLPFTWPRLKEAERVLSRAERVIALISRCQPCNASSEQQRLLRAWRSGSRVRPRWSYSAVPDLAHLRRELWQVMAALPQSDALASLYIERGRELELETRLVEAIGTPDMPQLATQRFGLVDREAWAEAEQLAQRWSRLQASTTAGLIRSDEPGNAHSLLSRMNRTIGELKLPVQVKLSFDLSAAAATGQALILVAAGRQLSRTATERIVVHEVLGHALPRYRATLQSLGLFAVGSARGNDEQEGYALYLERRAGLMDDARQRELGLRHIAALAVRAGADWFETVQQLRDCGAKLEEALGIASRVHRAGGLAREIVYLPTLCRVMRSLSRDPSIEDWLACGRLSLEAVASLRSQVQLRLRSNGSAHENSVITGT